MRAVLSARSMNVPSWLKYIGVVAQQRAEQCAAEQHGALLDPVEEAGQAVGGDRRGLISAKSFQVPLRLSHRSRVSAVATARPLLRAVFDAGFDARGIVLVEQQMWITSAPS